MLQKQYPGLNIEVIKNSYFKWNKKIIDSDVNNSPIFWIGGWPDVLKKHIKYRGQFFYINTHYNRFANIPLIGGSIQHFSQHICSEILNLTNSKTIILAGYSIGAVFSLELAKLLTSKGKNIKTLYLLDPSNTLYIKHNQISTSKNHNRFINLLLLKLNKTLFYSRSYYYKFFWDISQLLHINLITRRQYIYSIYACYRMKYNFTTYNGNVAIIQRKNNKSKTLFNWSQLFKTKLLKTYHIKCKNHSDFFQNTECIQEWTDIFNKEIS